MALRYHQTYSPPSACYNSDDSGSATILEAQLGLFRSVCQERIYAPYRYRRAVLSFSAESRSISGRGASSIARESPRFWALYCHRIKRSSRRSFSVLRRCLSLSKRWMRCSAIAKLWGRFVGFSPVFSWIFLLLKALLIGPCALKVWRVGLVPIRPSVLSHKASQVSLPAQASMRPITNRISLSVRCFATAKTPLAKHAAHPQAALEL